jgi:lactoylglutathione lyase
MQWCSSHPTWPVLSMAKCWRSTAVNRGLSRPSAVEARRVEEIKMAQKIAIERVDHIGVRVRDLDRALAFYGVLGFELLRRAEGDDVAIICNEHGVELNLVFNANSGDQAANILMDAPDKFPGYTHIALRVASIPATIAALKANDIAITQGPVSFGEAGHVSVSIRDPDRNVIELRGRDQGQVEGVTRYLP